MDKTFFLFINSLRGGGAEGVCITIANCLIDRGFHVILIVLNLDNAVRKMELNSKIELVVLNKKHARAAFFSLFSFIKNTRPRTILTFNYQLAILLVVIRFILRQRFYIISRSINTLSEIEKYEVSFWYKRLVPFITNLFYKRVDCVIAQSAGMKADLVENYGFSEDKVIKISNPVNHKIELFLKKNVMDGKRDDYILCVGRLDKQKAFHYVIEAFSLISADYPLLRLKIVGQGGLEDTLRQLTYTLNIHQKVDFEGYQSDIISYYTHARLTVLTSLFEGFPNVLIESITLGTPVVAFDCPSGPREIIQNGINGYLVQYKDVIHLTECLRISLNREWNGENIRFTSRQYDSNKIINEYISILTM
jgi:glycosyltransferase involved in cell wall biosynthesis